MINIEQKLKESKGIKLQQKIMVYLPYNTLKAEIAYKKFLKFLVNLTGGASLYKGRGIWIDPDSGEQDGSIDDEDILICEAYHNMSDNELSSVLEALGVYGIEADQIAVGFSINGTFYSVYPSDLIEITKNQQSPDSVKIDSNMMAESLQIIE